MPRTARPGARSLFLVATSLTLMLAATSLPAAAYDPGRPTSNKQGSQPPGGGEPGGGGPGGGEPGGSTRKVALGMATPDGRSIGVVDSFTSSIGGIKPAIWVIWSQWGQNATRAFPTSMANSLRDRNITPMIWWEPVNPANFSDPTYPRHRNISDGNHDAYIRQFARDARDFGGTVLLRFAHEANNNYFPWSINEFDNSPSTFIAAWRHVHGIFQQEGATNVRFVWSVAKKACAGGCNPYLQVYPGDAWVDVMAFSGYNWGTYGTHSWQTMYETYQKATRQLGEVSGKPIMVAETASNSEGGDKPAWVRDGYREVFERLPEIKAIVYLNADLGHVGHPDWRVSSPAGALAAYAEIAALDRFDTRSPFKSGKRAQQKAKLADRDVQKKRKPKSSAPEKDKPARKSAPRVRKGSAVQEEPKDPSDGTATKRQNRKTKPRKDEDAGPPAVLDTFSR